MKGTVQLTEGRRDRGERWSAMVALQDRIRLLNVVLAGAIVLTVFCLPLSESFKNIGYGIALVAYLTLIIVGGWEEIIVPPVSVLLLGSVAVAIASALVSADPRQAWRGVWEVFRYSSFFFLVCRGIRGPKWVLAFLWVAVAGVGLAATIGLGRALAFGFTIHHFTMFSLGNKNAVAQYLVMMLAVMLGMWDRLPVGRRGAAVLVVGGGSSLILLGLSSARTMWVGLFVVVLVLVGSRRVRLVLPALLVFVAVVVGVALVKPDVARRVAALSRSETYLDFGERIEIWRSAVRLWRDHPWLGIGPRTFRLYAGAGSDASRARYGIPKGVTQAHNIWLQVGAEMGTLGVLAMASWVVAFSIWLIRQRASFAEGALGAAWAGAAGALAATLVAGVTEPAIGHEHAILLMGLLGIVMGAQARAASGCEPSGGFADRGKPCGFIPAPP